MTHGDQLGLLRAILARNSDLRAAAIYEGSEIRSTALALLLSGERFCVRARRLRIFTARLLGSGWKSELLATAVCAKRLHSPLPVEGLEVKSSIVQAHCCEPVEASRGYLLSRSMPELAGVHAAFGHRPNLLHTSESQSKDHGRSSTATLT